MGVLCKEAEFGRVKWSEMKMRVGLEWVGLDRCYVKMKANDADEIVLASVL